MKPGHGEVLIAEGDVERAEDEHRMTEEFRRVGVTPTIREK